MALGLLARSADVAALAPGTVTALADLMWRRGLDPAPVLVRAQFAHPGDFLIPFTLGLYARDPAERIAHYRAARAVQADSYPLLTNLGNALRTKGDHDGAVACHREALRLDPTLALAHYNLGNALGDKGDMTGAIAAFKEAIRLDPRHPGAHNVLGTALKDKGDLPDAIAAYREAIRLVPKYAQAHNNLRYCLQMTGDLDGAIACYREAIRLDSKLPQPRNNLDRVLKLKAERDAKVAPPPRPVDRP
jgi:tetratricopeptide (TPR) repeat protein